MSLSAADKAKVVARAMKARMFKTRKASQDQIRMMYLYDPVNDRCLPAVCDEQGYIKIDPEELDERYLRLTGGEMKGNITFDADDTYDIGTSSNRLAQLWAKELLRIYTIEFRAGATKIRTRAGATNYFWMQSHDGAAYKNVMQFIGGYADFPRAGDITPLAGKKIDCHTNLGHLCAQAAGDGTGTLKPALGYIGELRVLRDGAGVTLWARSNNAVEDWRGVLLNVS